MRSASRAHAIRLTADWRARVKRREPEALMFSTWSGKPISPNNIVRRWIVPACDASGISRVTWLTLRRTYSSWAHKKKVPGQGHRADDGPQWSADAAYATARQPSQWITSEGWLAALDDFRNWLIREAA
jgi:hypothetical protein